MRVAAAPFKPDVQTNSSTACGSREQPLRTQATKPLPRHAAFARSRASMADPRIIHIELDEATILWRNADIEQERRIAIFDLIEENTFKPLRAWEAGHQGPYRVKLAVEEGRLALEIADADGQVLELLVLALGRFRRPIRDYFAICDSYYQAIRKATASEIETIDMARRGVHNEAAELLVERLEGKVETDFATARRLFTLICVLHIRG
jgi:uncharacterized protein (UPF0262 family)